MSIIYTQLSNRSGRRALLPCSAFLDPPRIEVFRNWIGRKSQYDLSSNVN